MIPRADLSKIPVCLLLAFFSSLCVRICVEFLPCFIFGERRKRGRVTGGRGICLRARAGNVLLDAHCRCWGLSEEREGCRDTEKGVREGEIGGRQLGREKVTTIFENRLMGGPTSQQSGSTGPHISSNEADTGDAVLARWLQSAGLQHLAAPLAAAALDHRLLPSLLMQDYARYGVQSLEDKQKLFRLIKTISSGAEPVSEPSTPPAFSRQANSSGMEAFLSPDFRGDFGPGILDLHSIDDSILFSEGSMSEPFHSSPSFNPVIDRGFEAEFDSSFNFGKQQTKQRFVAESSPVRSSALEKERAGRDNNVARIKVVVRKRPVNKKEISRKEDDIVSIEDRTCSVTLHEPKLKVDLTAYVEKHEFFFDAVLDDHVSNDEVYNTTVEPIVPAIFHRTKATCFAYGQTGSGKTYTMQPLPLRASEDILALMQQPTYRQEGFQLWLSFFEIYGGKLFDLLNERRKLCMREDGRQQVCIVGLQEYRVSDVQLVREYIDKGNASRSTGSTGANEESSRSHAILQLVVKKTPESGDTRAARPAGKLSFIDLAGSERGADTTDNDRQTRMEGAEINKSLLALKECIRALDNDQGHIPFRGSKLTEVLRDSFMGDSRTVMISCISPNTGSCEHTLNTLRYADRVKGLSRNNVKKESTTVQVIVNQRETNISPPPVPSVQPVQQAQQVSEHQQQIRPPDRYLWNSHLAEREGLSEYGFLGREESSKLASVSEKERISFRDNSGDSGLGNFRDLSSAPGVIPESQEQERHQLVLPRRKGSKEDKFERSLSIDRNSSIDRISSTDRNLSLDRTVPLERNMQMDRHASLDRTLSMDRTASADRNLALDRHLAMERTLQMDRSHIADRNVQTDRKLPMDRNLGMDRNLPTDRNSAIDRNLSTDRSLLTERNMQMDRFLSTDRGFPTDRNLTTDRNLAMDRSLGQVREEVAKSDLTNGILRRHNPREDSSLMVSQFALKEADSELGSLQTGYDGHINAILEEEEEVISAHRKEVEDTMEIVREEMKLLAEVDRPGSRIDRYVSQLNYVLSKKAAGIVNLQAKLTRFQRHLKEQEILSRTSGRQP